MTERVRFTRRRPARSRSSAGREPARRALERRRARGAHVGGRRAARAALRHGHLLRVPRHDGRRAARRACLEPVREGMEVALDARGVVRRRAAPAHAVRSSGGVVVVGGGPAGIARGRARGGGGRAHAARRRRSAAAGRPDLAPRAASRRRAGARGSSGSRAPARRCVTGATVVDAPAPAPSCSSSAPARAPRVDFERLVLATGARELFLPFPGWTLPGVVGAGGAQALAEGRRARSPACRVVVAGSGPLLLAVAAALRAAGARVVGHRRAGAARPARSRSRGTSPCAPRRSSRDSATARGSLGTPYRTGTWVREAIGTDALERRDA